MLQEDPSPVFNAVHVSWPSFSSFIGREVATTTSTRGKRVPPCGCLTTDKLGESNGCRRKGSKRRNVFGRGRQNHFWWVFNRFGKCGVMLRLGVTRCLEARLSHLPLPAGINDGFTSTQSAGNGSFHEMGCVDVARVVLITPRHSEMVSTSSEWKMCENLHFLREFHEKCTQ